MKRILIIYLLVLGGCEPKSVTQMSVSPRAAEQNIQVAKNPGDPTTIWFWNVPAQSSFDGIRVESATKLEGPYSDMSLTIPKTALSVTFPAPSTAMFYRPYYYKGATRAAVSSNVVQTSVYVAPPIPPEPPQPIPPLGPAPVITAR